MAFGSFVTGLFNGVEIRHGWEDRKRRQKLEDEDYGFKREQRDWDREDREYTRGERDHQRSERQRAIKLREEEEALNRKAADAAKAAMDAAKKGGVTSPFAAPGGDPAAPTTPAAAAPPPAAPGRTLPGASGATLTFGNRVPTATARDLNMGRPDTPPPAPATPGVDPAVNTRLGQINSELDRISALEADPTATTPQQRASMIEEKNALTNERDAIVDRAIKAGGDADPTVKGGPPPVNLTFGDRTAQPAAQPDAAAAAAATPAPAEAAKTGVAAIGAPEAPQADGTTAGAGPNAAAAGAAGAAAPAVQAMGNQMAAAPTGKGGKPAKAAQADALDAFMDAYVSQSVPMLVEGYIRLGQHDKAMAFAEFAQSKKAQKNMRLWAVGVQKAMMGDEDGTLDAFAEYYNNFDDGYTIVRNKSGFRRSADGQVEGIEMVFRDEKTGKTFKQFMAGGIDLLEQGVMGLAPEKMFELMYQRVTAGQQGASDAAKANLAHQRAIELKGGGAGGMTRQDAAKLIADKNPAFFNLPPDQQAAAIDQFMQAVNGGGAQPAQTPPISRTVD